MWLWPDSHRVVSVAEGKPLRNVAGRLWGMGRGVEGDTPWDSPCPATLSQGPSASCGLVLPGWHPSSSYPDEGCQVRERPLHHSCPGWGSCVLPGWGGLGALRTPVASWAVRRRGAWLWEKWKRNQMGCSCFSLPPPRLLPACPSCRAGLGTLCWHGVCPVTLAATGQWCGWHLVTREQCSGVERPRPSLPMSTPGQNHL